MILSKIPEGVIIKHLVRKNLMFPFLAVIMILPSCLPHSKVVYLQRDTEIADTIPFNLPEYFIRPGDILHIQVLSLDEKSNDLFNIDRNQQRTGLGGSGALGNMEMFLQGYSVDNDGTVNIPVVGTVQVAGKTIKEATKVISERVEEFLIGATVVVKLVNFSVNIIGEVRNPGKHFVYDNRVSIIDVISVAGGLTDYGNRNITVIRQTSEGATFGSINVGDASAIQSEYYFLQPGDIVYVEPYRIKRLGISQFPFSLVFSSLSFILFLVSYFSEN